MTETLDPTTSTIPGNGTSTNPDDDARISMVLGIVGTGLGALSLGILSIVSLILGSSG